MKPAADWTDEVRRALADYFQAVELQKSPDLDARPSLLPHFKKLDELCARPEVQSDGRLHHFLERKSYQKAAEHLEPMSGS